LRKTIGWKLLLAGCLLGSYPVTGSAAPPDGDRLGDTVLPRSEAIELTLDPGKPAYSGKVRIDLEVKAATADFALHARNLQIGTIALSGPGGAGVPLTSQAAPTGLLRLHAGAPLQPGRYQLAIDFTNPFDTKGSSLYKLEAEGRSYTASQFQPDEARRAFPCWDEPGFKIPYQITLRVPEDHLAVSNTPVEHRTVEGGWATVRFARTHPLPSYLLAIATGPYDAVPIAGLSVPGSIVTLKGKSGLAAEVSRLIPPLLAATEGYFGRRYPYEKLDFIAIPGFWAVAMENPGAVMFDENRFLISAKARLSQRRDVVSLIAHELAHMWFGDLVTMAWWDDLWLNEAFASWMSNKIGHQVYPELGLDLSDIPETRSAMANDANPAIRAIRRPVKASNNISLNADALTYKKGRAVLAMFERWLGADTFRLGIRRYLAAHEWGNTTAADLSAALSKASGKEVGPAMNTFLEQGGIPIVSARVLPGGRVEFSQARFVPAGTAPPAPQTWQIPMTIRFSDGARLRTEPVLLSRQTQVVDLHLDKSPAWLFPNADQAGYYHWQLPPDLLRALMSRGTPALSTREKIGLLSDLSVLVEGGSLSGAEYLRALTGFAGAPEPQVVSDVSNALEDVRFRLIPAELGDPFAVYLRRTLGPALRRYGLAKNPGEDETVTGLRPLLVFWLAKYGHDEEVLSRAESLARSYLADPASVDPTLVETVLSLAALRGDRALFETYRQRFEAATVPAERRQYLLALGSFTDPALVEATLNYVLTGPLQPQEIFIIPRRMGNSPLLLGWITKSYETLKARVPAQQIAYLPLYAMGCSGELLATATAFFSEPDHQVAGMDTQLARTTNQVTQCVKLREREGAGIAAYLQGLAAGA
jgi:alanyl aminopeptidase